GYRGFAAESRPVLVANSGKGDKQYRTATRADMYAYENNGRIARHCHQALLLEQRGPAAGWRPRGEKGNDRLSQMVRCSRGSHRVDWLGKRPGWCQEGSGQSGAVLYR